MKTHKVNFQNDGNQIWQIDLAPNLPYVQLRPGSKMQVTVDESSIYFKYDSLRWDSQNNLHAKRNKNWRIPQENDNTFVLHIQNNRDDCTNEIFNIGNTIYRLFPGVEHWVTFDRIADSDDPMIVFKAIAVHPPRTEVMDNGRGWVKEIKVPQIEYVRRDREQLKEIWKIQAQKKRKRLGLVDEIK